MKFYGVELPYDADEVGLPWQVITELIKLHCVQAGILARELKSSIGVLEKVQRIIELYKSGKGCVVRVKISEIPVLHPSEFGYDNSAKYLGLFFEVHKDGDELTVVDRWGVYSGEAAEFTVVGIADWHPYIMPNVVMTEGLLLPDEQCKCVMIHIAPTEENPEGIMFWQHFFIRESKTPGECPTHQDPTP